MQNAILGVLILLGACASAVEQRSQPLIGQPVSAALEAWGPPDKETTTADVTYMGWDFRHYGWRCQAHLAVQDGIVRRFSMSSDAESCWHAIPEIPGADTWR